MIKIRFDIRFDYHYNEAASCSLETPPALRLPELLLYLTSLPKVTLLPFPLLLLSLPCICIKFEVKGSTVMAPSLTSSPTWFSLPGVTSSFASDLDAADFYCYCYGWDSIMDFVSSIFCWRRRRLTSIPSTIKVSLSYGKKSHHVSKSGHAMTSM